MSEDFRSAKIPMSDSVSWDENESREGYKYLGKQFDGNYVEHKTEVGQNKSNIYVIELDDGSLVSVWGTMLIDDQFLKGNHHQPIPVGSRVRFTNHGKKPSTRGAGKSYHDIEVAWRPQDMQSASPHTTPGIATTSAPAPEKAPSELGY